MAQGIFEHDKKLDMHCGAIYEAQPIYWLNDPPLKLIRDIQYTRPRSGTIYYPNELRDSFKNFSTKNQEDIIVSAKLRPVVIISHDYKINENREKNVLIAPFYSIHEKRRSYGFLENLRSMKLPGKFYINPQNSFSNLREGYIDLENTSKIPKTYLEKIKKLNICFTDMGMKALIQYYKQYLRTVVIAF